MPFSNDYFRLFDDTPAFHDRVARRYALASEGGRISERLLRCIWYDRLFDESGLATAEGEGVVIHSPGTWNLGAGPDFKRADLSIGGKRLRGDVELHIDPAGWRQHGHADDPRYDGVVLHVTLAPRAESSARRTRAHEPATTRHGVPIPEVALWDCLTDDLRVLACALRPDEYPYRSTRNFGRCRGLLEELPPETTRRLLELAGDARMIAKQKRFAYEAERRDLDEVAYAAVLEGMGYKAHVAAFGRLAQKLPYAGLRERVRSAERADAARLTQALLLGAAGLLPTPGEDTPSDAAAHLAELQRLWREHGFDNLPGGDIAWKAAAVRPANQPQRRIAGVSHVLARSYEAGLFELIVERVREADARKARRGCIDFLTRAEDDFWLHRYTAAGRSLPKPVALVGGDRAWTIVVNAFVPLALLAARRESREADEDRVHRFFTSAPSLSANAVTRLMEHRMFGGSPKQRVARSAQMQQGLLQIFADWCSEDPSCERCGVFAGLQRGSIRDRIQEFTRA
jgi:hypothetical protein